MPGDGQGSKLDESVAVVVRLMILFRSFSWWSVPIPRLGLPLHASCANCSRSSPYSSLRSGIVYYCDWPEVYDIPLRCYRGSQCMTPLRDAISRDACVTRFSRLYLRKQSYD